MFTRLFLLVTLDIYLSFTLFFLSSFAIFLLLIMLSDFDNLAQLHIFRNGLEQQRNLQLYTT